MSPCTPRAPASIASCTWITLFLADAASHPPTSPQPMCPYVHQSAYHHVRVCAATDGTWRRLLIRSRRSSPKRTARASRGMAARASSMGPTAGCRGSSGAAATRQSERWDLTTARSHGCTLVVVRAFAHACVNVNRNAAGWLVETARGRERRARGPLGAPHARPASGPPSARAGERSIQKVRARPALPGVSLSINVHSSEYNSLIKIIRRSPPVTVRIKPYMGAGCTVLGVGRVQS